MQKNPLTVEVAPESVAMWAAKMIRTEIDIYGFNWFNIDPPQQHATISQLILNTLRGFDVKTNVTINE